MGAVEEVEMAIFKTDMESNYVGTLCCIKAVNLFSITNFCPFVRLIVAEV